MAETPQKDGLHTTSAESSEDSTPKEPPDGGWFAWLQVSGSFVLYFNTLGLLNTFGVFQAYYERELLRDSSPSAISWIGSVQTFCLMALGVVIGPLYDLGHLRALLVGGTALVTLGLMATSVSTRYWQVLLAQGFCVGLGTCCLSIPSIALVPPYFSARRARAMGIATVGSSLGGTLYPLLFQGLQPRLGFGWTVRVMGFVVLGMCSYSVAVMRRRGGGERRKKVGGVSLLRSAQLLERPYLVYCAAIFFSNTAFFEPLFYLESYALAHGMRANERLAGFLLAILNAASVPGRIVPSLAADWVRRRDRHQRAWTGPLAVFVVVCFCTAACDLFWIGARGTGGNVAFSALYGFFSGGVVSLAPVVLACMTTDLGRLGTRLGFVSVLKGIGSLVGPPAGGALLGATGSFLGIQLFAAGLAGLSAALFMGLWVVLQKHRHSI